MSTIRELLGLSPVQPYTSSKAQPMACADPALLYGVELEIEHIFDYNELLVRGMDAHDDNSLRNGGKEFVTKPATFSVMAHVLKLFFEKGKFQDRNYSERCSVHVHANCQDLTIKQVTTVALLYQAFEKLFYHFVGANRFNNIFCVPWIESGLTSSILLQFVEKQDILAGRHWMKYSGLNLLPLYNLGTVEFRQMPGTPDLAKILTWCNIIGCLFRHARSISLEDTQQWIMSLNTSSAYGSALDSVFGPWSGDLLYPGYEIDLEEGVLAVKYALSSSIPATSRPMLEVNNRFRPRTDVDDILAQIRVQENALRNLARTAPDDQVVVGRTDMTLDEWPIARPAALNAATHN